MDENKHVRYVLVEVIERDISEPVFAETADAARDAMRQMVCQAVGADEDTPWDDVLEEIRACNGDMDETSAYCENHGNNYDWKTFEI